MSLSRNIFAAALSSFLWATLGCGFKDFPFQAAPVAATPAERLEGNWLVFGALPELNSPSPTQGLALSLSTGGDAIIGAASLSGKCASGEPFLIIFGNAISAVPDTTGHFITSSTQTFGWGFTLMGTAPNLAGQPWSGTFQLTNDGTSNFCAFSGSGTFTAAPVGQLTGIFRGTGTVTTSGGSGAVAGVGFTATLTQGATLSNPNGSTTYDAQLLAGTIQISGVSCFTHGVSSAPSGGSLVGNEFLANFTMNDGSVLQAVGTIENTTTTHLLLNSFSVVGGACPGNYVLTAPGAPLAR